VTVLLVKAKDVRVGDYVETNGRWMRVLQKRAGKDAQKGPWVALDFELREKANRHLYDPTWACCVHKPEWLLAVGRDKH